MNRPAFLSEAVLSCLSQSRLPAKVHIIDNASKPEVLEAISKIKGSHPNGHLIEWHSLDAQVNVERNFDRAFKTPTTDFVYVMHDDDKIASDFIAKIGAFIDAHPDVIAVGTCARTINESGEFGRSISFSSRWNTQNDALWFRSPAELAHFYAFEFIPFPSIIYKRNISGMRGMLEADGKARDVLFLCELTRHGPLACLRDELLHYRVHGGQDSASFPEKDVRKMEDYILRETLGSPKLFAEVLPRIAAKRARRKLAPLVPSLLKSRLKPLIKSWLG